MLPLDGRTVLVTRPAHQAGSLAQKVFEAGGEAFVFPALGIEPVALDELADALAYLAGADIVIFVSPNAAQYGLAAIRARGTLPDAGRFFAVGPGTARALAAQGLEGAVTPDGQDSEALLALPELQAVAGQRVVIVRGVGGRPLMSDTLRARGADVHFMECYRRTCPPADPSRLLARWRAGGIDAVTIASAETLYNLARLLVSRVRPCSPPPRFSPRMRKSPKRLVASALRASSPRQAATMACWMVWLTGSGTRQALKHE